MKAIILIGLLIFVGCSSPSRVTKAEIKIQCGSNVVSVAQPKDTIIDRMEFDPKSGKLVLYGYQSTANAAAIEASRAQSQMQADVTKYGLAVIQALAERAAESQGLPKGYKLVPANDPSTPKPEIE
jgi:hypothetical protein